MELEADGRHVEVLRASLNLDGSAAKGVDTPRVKRSEAEAFAALQEPKLNPRDTTTYRSGTMRLSYLAQDRADVQEAAKCLAQHMKDPNESDMRDLKRAVRYLIKYPRAVLKYEEQDVPQEVHGWVDSDYAGDVVCRKSTSGVVVMYGSHCLKTSSTVQEPIGLSSGESEYYAAVRGGTTLLGLASLMQDWKIECKPILVLKTDSSAAKGFACRQGLGRNRHVSTRFLWLQAAVATKRLKIQKVSTKDQLGDMLTKPMTQQWLQRIFPRMSIEFKHGQAAVQKKALLRT